MYTSTHTTERGGKQGRRTANRRPRARPASGDRFFHAHTPPPPPPSSPVQPSFPSRGGATGSIRFKNELAHGANAGLNKALDFLTPVAAAHADVSFADLIQLAGAVAVEATGGPKLAMRYGRKDAAGPLSVVKEGNLPAGGAPWPAPSTDAASHLRAVFHRMGMSDAEIVALSGAHTIGRARTTRSGFGKESTKYTDDTAKGTPGGTSWTPDFQTFNNSYFTEVKKAVTGSRDPDLLVLDTDKVRVRGERKGGREREKKGRRGPCFFDRSGVLHQNLSHSFSGHLHRPQVQARRRKVRDQRGRLPGRLRGGARQAGGAGGGVGVGDQGVIRGGERLVAKS